MKDKPKKREVKKKRVKDLASQLGLSNKALIDMLQGLGYTQVKSHGSIVTKEMEKAVRSAISKAKREHREDFERKKKIWGEDEKKEKQESRKRQKRFQQKEIKERVSRTLSKMERGQAKPKRKKKVREAEIEEEEKKVLVIPGPLPVGEFAKMLGVESVEIVEMLFKQGIMATINQTIDVDTMSIIAEEYGYEVELKTEEIEEVEEEEVAELKPRPPVVTVMGHVDHGKTTLLDYLRKTNVAAREAGGITQHIGAYQVEVDGEKITFIDTPGHEAFTALRARGAQVTDIVVLVVAANEGVKPQTVEAINHAKAARVPIIVAMNKMDLPDADPEKVRRELSTYELIPEEWGGDTIMVEISAKTGQGVPDLLDAILLKAAELDLKAPYEGKPRGVILESGLEKGRGPVGTVLVQKGTLKIGMPFVAGTTHGRVRAMYNEFNQRIQEATPGTPVLVQGFEELPHAGDIFYVVDSDYQAREIAEEKKRIKKEQLIKGESEITIRRIQEKLKAGELKELPVIIKADKQGSLEAISDMLSKMVYEEVKVTIVHQGIGDVKESDILLASAAEGIIIAFNVGVFSEARKLAKSEGVVIKTYRVIYELFDDVKNLLSSLLEPETVENVLGQAEVKRVFHVPKIGNVAGCIVINGVIRRDANVRIKRGDEIIYEGKIASLKRFKDDVKEVAAGYECGIKVEGFDKIKPEDIIEAFEIKKVQKKLE